MGATCQCCVLRQSSAMRLIPPAKLVTVAVLALVVMSPAASDPAPNSAAPVLPRGPTCTCPAPDEAPAARPSPRPKFAELQSVLDQGDEVAALEAVAFALAEVGDGSTFVFHRRNGRLSGTVKLTQSFKDDAGRVCRRVVVTLDAASRTASTEGTACRMADGGWQL